MCNPAWRKTNDYYITFPHSPARRLAFIARQSRRGLTCGIRCGPCRRRACSRSCRLHGERELHAARDIRQGTPLDLLDSLVHVGAGISAALSLRLQNRLSRVSAISAWSPLRSMELWGMSFMVAHPVDDGFHSSTSRHSGATRPAASGLFRPCGGNRRRGSSGFDWLGLGFA